MRTAASSSLSCLKSKRTAASPWLWELEPLRNFYPAEDYHQNYLQNHPHGYCHTDFQQSQGPHCPSGRQNGHKAGPGRASETADQGAI
ncbi:MAG: peptide-methionine (S)-S-oxide reductase [Enterocloster bolteae]